MEKSQLLSLAKVYFENSDELQQIHASEDGHFFYGEGQVIQYCKKKDKQHFLLTRDEVLNAAKPKTNKEILQEKAEVLDIEDWESLSVAKLRSAIADKELADKKRKELVDEAITLNLEGYEELSDEDLEELIDKTKADAENAGADNDKRDALIEEAKSLELEDYEELSDEDLETKISEFKAAAEELKVKKARFDELEAKGDERTDDEDDEHEDLVAELGD